MHIIKCSNGTKRDIQWKASLPAVVTQLPSQVNSHFRCVLPETLHTKTNTYYMCSSMLWPWKPFYIIAMSQSLSSLCCNTATLENLPYRKNGSSTKGYLLLHCLQGQNKSQTLKIKWVSTFQGLVKSSIWLIHTMKYQLLKRVGTNKHIFIVHGHRQ